MDTSLWVFGYGSLCWFPGFDFGDKVLGHIQGFSRKFWQGNTTHRGTEDRPGRVATLVEESHTETHGLALKLKDEASLEYLNNREVTLGGYVSHITLFYPRDATLAPFPVLLYIATPDNKHWLGPASVDLIADQVVSSQGTKGHNVEYVLKLAQWIRDTLPDVHDEHLFALEEVIRTKVRQKKLCLAFLMGEHQSAEAESSTSIIIDDVHDQDKRRRRLSLEAHHDQGHDFASKVSHQKLRCLKL